MLGSAWLPPCRSADGPIEASLYLVLTCLHGSTVKTHPKGDAKCSLGGNCQQSPPFLIWRRASVFADSIAPLLSYIAPTTRPLVTCTGSTISPLEWFSLLLDYLRNPRPIPLLYKALGRFELAAAHGSGNQSHVVCTAKCLFSTDKIHAKLGWTPVSLDRSLAFLPLLAKRPFTPNSALSSCGDPFTLLEQRAKNYR